MKTKTYEIHWAGRGYSGEPWTAKYEKTSLEDARQFADSCLKSDEDTATIFRVEVNVAKIEVRKRRKFK